LRRCSLPESILLKSIRMNTNSYQGDFNLPLSLEAIRRDETEGLRYSFNVNRKHFKLIKIMQNDVHLC
jgi:hypothetical protein